MPFLVTVEARDLGHVFLGPAVSASSRGRASVFSTLVLLLIQTSMLFLLSPGLFVESLATSGGRGIGRLQCRRWRGFFNGIVASFLTESLRGSRVEEACDLATME